jgi:hypothetical protein
VRIKATSVGMSSGVASRNTMVCTPTVALSRAALTPTRTPYNLRHLGVAIEREPGLWSQ